jgi:hypothetical protein
VPRYVTLQFESANDKTDFVELQKRDKLKPMERYLKSVEDFTKKIKQEFEYFRAREAVHRDTNGM